MTPAIPDVKVVELDEQDRELAKGSAEAWLDVYKIKNEKGEPITFHKHLWQKDIYEDQSQKLVVTKAAQVGLSTLEILKNIRDAEMQLMDIIYTLPTDNDVSVFVGGKVNRIIQNNPHLGNLTKDKDSIEQKQIGKSMLYFRGTWTKKAAIMITGDRLVHDEKDTSKQDVVADYQARLQHSKFKQIHVFSHPSVPNNGVDVEWQISDQKEWFITCPHCQHQQYLSWNTEDDRQMSIDLERQEYICKRCKGVLDWKVRAKGVWKRRKGREIGATVKNKDGQDIKIEYSGYHVSLLMNPDTPASEVIKKYNEVLIGKQTMDFFYNKVLGLPYAGGGNSVSREDIMNLITPDANLFQGRLVIGVDTGVKLRFVVGNQQGLVGFGEMTDYMPDDINQLPLDKTLEYFLKKFPNSIMVIDQGGDIIGSRKLRQKYPGRVFLCHYNRDRKTMQLIRWGEKDESGNVQVDRNRMIQLVVDEVRGKKFFLFNGNEAVWYDYYLHWSHIYRVAEQDNLGVTRYVWLRNDRDDWVHATVYWRVGIDRFGQTGAIVGAQEQPEPNSYIMNPDQSVTFNPDDMFGRKGTPRNHDPDEVEEEPWWTEDTEGDWRNI